MNINTFFLDKLSSVSPQPTSKSGKISQTSYLFSDIMKVYDQGKATNLETQPDSLIPISNTIEEVDFPENLIEYTDVKIKSLSDFIESFIANSTEPINVSELTHELQPVVISKKQFLISSGGMEEFLKGLIEELNLTFGDELKATVTSSKSSDEKTGLLSVEKKNSEKEADENISTDTSLTNIVAMLDSAQAFLSNNKSMSLSFKSSFEKVNINFYELPEENFETKINLEKLTLDFIKEGKDIFAAGLEPSTKISKEEPYPVSSAIMTDNNPAENSLPLLEKTDQSITALEPGMVNSKAVLKSFNIPGLNSEKIYKTEIIETSYSPDAVLIKPGNVVDSKTDKFLADPVLLSSLPNSSPEDSTVKFRLNDNNSMHLNVDVSPDKNILFSPTDVNTENTNSGYLYKSDSAVNISQELSAISRLNEKQEALKNTNTLLDGLNGKLVSVEYEKSILTKETIDNAGVKQFYGESVKENKAAADKSAGGTTIEKDPLNSKPGHNVIEASQNANQMNNAGNVDNNSLQALLNGKLLGTELKAQAGKVDNSKVANENENIKSTSEEVSKVNEISVKDADGKSSNEKDLTKHKSNESFKNILQSVDQTSGVDSEIFKVSQESKQAHDLPKTIRTHEIIPEFSKIIQTGEKQSMTFQLTPENLGKIKLIVELINNQINTRIEVENEQIKQFIQSNVEQLKQNMQATGVQLNAVNVSLTESDQKFSKTFTARKKSGERVSKVKIGDEQALHAQKSLGYNTYEFLA